MEEQNIQSSLFDIGRPKVKEEPSEKKSFVIPEKEEEEKDDKPMCELNNHHWRDAWLKSSAKTKHIVYCTHCTRTKFNDDGTVQQWLLDQGYVRPEDESDAYVTDFGYGKK